MDCAFADDGEQAMSADPKQQMDMVIRLAEACIDVLQEVDEFHAEVKKYHHLNTPFNMLPHPVPDQHNVYVFN